MSTLNLFPARVPIGKAKLPDGMDGSEGQELDVLASMEFLKALKVLFERVGGASGTNFDTFLSTFADSTAISQGDATNLFVVGQLDISAAFLDLSKQVYELRIAVESIGDSAARIEDVRKYAQGLEISYVFAPPAQIDLASPGPIGSQTPSTGAFTTLTASGQITSTLATGTAPLVVDSVTKVTNLNADLLDGADWAAPGTIGSTTPSSATFTTVNKITFTQPAVSATFTLATGKTLTVSNTLTLTATDGSTLAIGTGGTLGTAAYTAASTYALLAGSTSQAFSTSTLAASDVVTVTKSNAGATVEVLSLKNSGGGASTKAGIGFYAAGTKYAAINGGYGAASPQLTFDISGATELTLASAGLAINAGFGCNTKAAQTAVASGGALAVYGAGANGLDTGANMSALHAMVVAIRAALVANGIMS